jgi:anti-sigma B factor antagonist
MPLDTGYTTDSPGPGTAVVTVSGEVTFTNVAGLSRELEGALGSGARNVVVDLTQVTFIDSSGLSALLNASKGARDAGGALALVLPEGDRPSIFRFRGVERLLSLHTSREAALASLA